jgi:tetratricopeptide (TPR) repeat protein
MGAALFMVGERSVRGIFHTMGKFAARMVWTMAFITAQAVLLAQDTALLADNRQELAAAKDDTARSVALARICFNLIQSDPDSARWYGEQALLLARRTGNLKALGDAWNNLGWLDVQYGRLDSGEARLSRALAHFKQIGNPSYLSVTLSNLGWVADKRGDQVGALRRFQDALHLAESTQDSASTAILLYALGTTYRKMGEPVKALEHLRHARAMELAMGRLRYEASCLLAIGNTVLTQGDTMAAIKAYKEVFPLFVRLGDKPGAGLVEENLGNAHMPRKPREALAHFTVAMAYYDSAGAATDKAYALLGAAKAYMALDRHSEALNVLMAGRVLAKATESTALVMDMEYTMAELAGKAGDAAGAVAHFTRYIAMKDSLEGADTQRELARLRTEFETERKEKDNALLRTENRAQQERIRQRNIQLNGLVALAVLALLAALLFRRNYRQKRRHADVLEGLNRQLEARNAEVKEINSLLESRLLRSQMNPHFIYNALGSAVQLTDAGRTAEATEYLRGFARLLRMVLDQSVDDHVALEDEMGLLRQYLVLEARRLPGLEFTVEAEQHLVQEDPEVPALIVQPFVENALWHGLAAKEQDRKLHVRFSGTGSNVVCTVLDNGVGRAANNGKPAMAGHRSLGMQLTRERVRLLARQLGGEQRIHVEDLYDEQGTPAGTRVTLSLSVAA